MHLSMLFLKWDQSNFLFYGKGCDSILKNKTQMIPCKSRDVSVWFVSSALLNAVTPKSSMLFADGSELKAFEMEKNRAEDVSKTT